MLRLIGLCMSIGLADSLNPTTIAPALYLATGDEHPARQVLEFTVGVFVVYFVGGAAIALGPGQLLLSLVPKPDADTRHLLEVIAGAALIAVGLLLWMTRGRLRRRGMPQPSTKGKSSAILGATITAVELPTAFPYFAAIAAIVGSGLDPLRQLFLLVLFNVCFILPLVGIWATLTFAGDRAERLLTIGRNFLERHWPTVLAILMLIAGVFVIVLGINGYTAHRRGRLGRLSRQLQNTLHLHP
jgi:cytochrome c biogenesis protein CcdA